MQARRRTSPGLIAIALACGAALLACGCTTVVIHSDGAVKTESRFGILHLNLAPERTTAVAVTSVGVVALPGSVSVGYTRWQGVGLTSADGNRCLLVTFDSPQQTGAEK
ncbi:hypothetical protein [Zoogloea sp. 1C4]|uniref:hypothetical protein n=1 Tax=Zoogloea sp. 1C4 TaxID=2570190 RepID=UPI001290E24B|nr:hypothetical protein [Zoogloea sp. 1C4]